MVWVNYAQQSDGFRSATGTTSTGLAAVRNDICHRCSGFGHASGIQTTLEGLRSEQDALWGPGTCHDALASLDALSVAGAPATMVPSAEALSVAAGAVPVPLAAGCPPSVPPMT